MHLILLFIVSGVATLQAVSNSTILLDPPDKLVLQVKSTGVYDFIQWSRNSIEFVTYDNFAHFTEILVINETTIDDLGVFTVELCSSQNLGPLEVVTFDVIEPGILNHITEVYVVK